MRTRADPDDDAARGRRAVVGDPPPFKRGLDRNAANFVPLSPVGFVERSATVYPSKVAVRHGRRASTYAQFHERCRRLASALARRGVRHGDTVAIMAPNIPPMLEAHYAVPALGAVLNPLNVRLDGRTIASCLVHGEAKVLLTDAEFAPVIATRSDRRIGRSWSSTSMTAKDRDMAIRRPAWVR